MDASSLLTQWSFEPLVTLGLLAAAILYVRGISYSLSRGIGPRIAVWRLLCFFAGLFTVLIALESVVDQQATRLFWVHMIQHDLLTMVAPPLLLLGLPLWPLWRAVPRGTRFATLRWALRRPTLRRLSRLLGALLTSPRVTLALFTGSYLLWHLPALYDLALEQPTVHILEHLVFLGTALLFWAQTIPSRPGAPHAPALSLPIQVLYLGAAALVMNVLGAVYVFSTGPLYPFYAALPRGADTTPLLVDQHLAGAAMDVPNTIVFFTVITILLWRWLESDEREASAERSPGSSAAHISGVAAAPRTPGGTA